MKSARYARDRGHADHGWLDSHHSFSFGEYHDSQHMGFGPLRVINEDSVAPGAGFGTHGHRDMEIISYVLSGSLAHRDSLGNGSTIRPGDVQRMSAGTGIQHSEFNGSDDHPVHFLQIWIEPDRRGLPPSYEEQHFDATGKRGCLRLIASPDRAEDSVLIHQDARLYSGLFTGAERAQHALAPGRMAYVHLVQGRLTVNDVVLNAGDALKLTDETAVVLHDGDNAEVLVFDLPVS
ncbi:MAG: pirin family protein [Haliea sp.]|nr:pirin family protein [Haliea sp.]